MESDGADKLRESQHITHRVNKPESLLDREDGVVLNAALRAQ